MTGDGERAVRHPGRCSSPGASAVNVSSFYCFKEMRFSAAWRCWRQGHLRCERAPWRTWDMLEKGAPTDSHGGARWGIILASATCPRAATL